MSRPRGGLLQRAGHSAVRVECYQHKLPDNNFDPFSRSTLSAVADDTKRSRKSRVLKPDGIAIFLFRHSCFYGVRRMYSANTTADTHLIAFKIVAGGFTPIRFTYFNTLLFPAYCCVAPSESSYPIACAFGNRLNNFL